MKRLFILAAAIATLVSCSKNEISSAANDSSATALSFENVYGRLTTRAANSVNGDNAYVLGRQNVYNSETETSSYLSTWYLEDGLGDDDTPCSFLSGYTYYWPTDATTTLDFLAFAPCPWEDIVFNEDGTVNTEESVSLGNFLPVGDYILDGHTYQNNLADVDAEDGYVQFTFMSVDGETELTAATTGTFNNTHTGTVSLSFIQLLAKLSVRLTLDTEMTTQGYTIESATVGVQVNSRRGIYEIDIDKPYTNYNSEAVCYQFTYPADASAMEFPAKDASPSSTATTNIVPQQASGCVLNIYDMVIYKDGVPAFDQATANVDSDGNPVAAEFAYTIQTNDIADNMFHEGIKYWLSLEIDLDDIFNNKIEFSATYSEFESLTPGTLDYE